MAHGYRLADVSLCEERVLASILSHKIKSDSVINLIAFISTEEKDLGKTLNTLELA